MDATEDPPYTNSLGRIPQFYGRQLKATAASIAIFVTVFVAAPKALESIPQAGFATLAGMFATLLGLTFAAFSILTALTPSVPRGLLRSRTFLMFGQTFVVTIWLQLATVLLSGLCYLAYGSSWVEWTGIGVLFLAILSTGFLIVVVHYMLYLFKLVRRTLAGPDAPDTVL
ncbi:MAG TPA: hypothetical protein VGS23_01310 [Thermoplasmata archaeon]|nr:hypothetical protein [Thermoplasmata archaeon]